MLPERYEVSDATAQRIEAARREGRRVVAVGTTVVRTLEAVALRHEGAIVAGSDWTELFIRPGFTFQVIDTLITNFHLPKSTLLMLVSAFAGRDQIMHAYEHALAHDYRFFSYGDAMLID
jgi:S-adenosylmethionine:tRNA ribosyltransferase-isomerase